MQAANEPVLAAVRRFPVNRRFCIAPMMDCSDRHSRFFLRLFSANILLYTEMVTAAAVVNGDRDRLLGFSQEEHPLAVQLGGSDPELLYRAAQICHEYGYDEINLNCGCPSDRVQSGSFGACLMLEPALVAECVAALKSATPLPVTVKHRTGVDQQDNYDAFAGFAAAQIDAGAEALIVHARNAWLQGLSPKQNREIPPLKYDWVYRLKRDFPKQEIIINGGIRSLEDCVLHLRQVDGVMLGREPYSNPYLLHRVDRVIFDREPADSPGRFELLHRFYPYIEQQLARGVPLTRIVRHLTGLFNGQPNARRWRRFLSENAYRKSAGIEVLRQAEQVLG
ncbi:MAG: tRNA dihydrouridine(20/20a) synthase DusA [Gammaproteobacteria bacterium]|nr:MAG: tRNA dihydrouridine(20/20a) synthase DusA [Gammaproteobacteria bacterium]UCH41000.1 MAG: tRNA dihydrouridine(20/20a) synthase DusA [Gammaproteobacteria bacterium]